MNVNVLIVPDGLTYWAQGVEIDYGAQGESAEKAKENFTLGLAATIRQNHRLRGHADDVVVAAPAEVLDELLTDPQLERWQLEVSLEK